MSPRYRVLITEDHTILTVGLRVLLGKEPDLEVIRGPGNGHNTVGMVAELQPDLVMLDFDPQQAAGTVSIAEIVKHCPKTRILVLTQQKSEDCIRAALRAGAHGYVLKDASDAELIAAVRRVLAGSVYLSPGVSDAILSAFLVGGRTNGAKSDLDSLTNRERQILKLVAEGYTSKYIAQHLSLSVKTVEKHRSNLMRKLDLHNVSALTTFAIGQGLVSTGL